MNDISQSITILNQGGIVIFPTDTAFGIGCRMDRQESIEKLFRLRRRPHTQATSVLVSGIEMAKNYLQPLTPHVEKLMRKYWPGGLTIIYTCITEKVPILVRGNTNTLGVRQPNHILTQQLISGIGVPLLGPSANFHGKETPYKFKDIDQELIKLVDFVVPGECSLKQASTVIDCSVDPWQIKRQGAVKIIGSPIILHIDTSNSLVTTISVEQNGIIKKYQKKTDATKSQNVLPLIEDSLKKAELTLKDLTEIKVVTGPGSFTGLRVGITVANTLGFILSIPVNGQKQALPTYEPSKFD